MIQLTEIKKKFGNHLVLDIPSFALDNGIYWIRGLNGSGKTTLLKILSGIIPFQGDVRIDGTSLKKKPVAYRRLISFAEAEPLYPGYLTGWDIVELFASVRKEKKEIVEELLGLFQVHYYVRTPIGTYSSGMLKKLSLVLAFIGKPSLIMLDEPLVTLDSENIPRIYDLIKNYQQQFGTSFLITSHQDIPDSASLIRQTLVVENQTLQIL
jgi:ABC-2 type transport system ATP-binding protein